MVQGYRKDIIGKQRSTLTQNISRYLIPYLVIYQTPDSFRIRCRIWFFSWMQCGE